MPDQANFQTIEIKGVKMQVDLRHARRIEEIRIGDKVRVLQKTYSSHEIHNGVVIGFEPFENLPTIVIAYMKIGYNEAEPKFVHWNAESKNLEVVKAVDDDLDLNKENMLSYFDRQRAKLEREMAELEERRTYFLDKFKTYWEPVKPRPEPEVSTYSDTDNSPL